MRDRLGEPAEDAAAAVSRHRWWHTIEVAPGVVTPGSWDLRTASPRMPWPATLAGLRCLDVGTMDGFWAFEMEARGATDVVAIDPAPGGGATFATAARVLGSRATFLDLDLFDLDPADHGRFDLVFAGYVTELLRDPLGALAALRRVCSGWLIALDNVSLPLSLLPRPLARVAARPGYVEWFVFNRRGLHRALEVSGFVPDADSGFLRDRPGPAVRRRDLSARVRLRHATGRAGVSLAVRGHASIPPPL